MITIALAAYNGEKYIEEQLDSLIEQDIDEDLSIVVADDGSADKTFGILCDYVERYPGLINAAVNEVPTGSAKGNFFGLLRSIDDDYVMLCDQDDVWNADKVRVTFERMKKLEAKYGKDTPLLVFGDVEVVDEGLNVISESMARYQKTAPHHNGLNHYLVQNNIIGCTVMINRALLNYTKYEPKVCMMHDWWLGLLASAFGHISFIDRRKPYANNFIINFSHSNLLLAALRESKQTDNDSQNSANHDDHSHRDTAGDIDTGDRLKGRNCQRYGLRICRKSRRFDCNNKLSRKCRIDRICDPRCRSVRDNNDRQIPSVIYIGTVNPGVSVRTSLIFDQDPASALCSAFTDHFLIRNQCTDTVIFCPRTGTDIDLRIGFIIFNPDHNAAVGTGHGRNINGRDLEKAAADKRDNKAAANHQQDQYDF